MDTIKQQQTLTDFLGQTIDVGSALYNDGKKKECFDVYLEAAELAVNQGSDGARHQALLKAAVTEALLLKEQQDYNSGAWELRRCFDEIRKQPESQQIKITTMNSLAPAITSNEKPEMQTLSQLLTDTINIGAPMYNQGDKRECLELYLETAKYAIEQDSLKKTAVGQRLQQAIVEATELQESQEWAEGAWVLRHVFDEILDANATGRRRVSVAMASNKTSSNDDISVGSDYWQDAAARNTTDLEKGQCLADTAYILRASITPKQHTRFTKTFEDCFQASEAVEVLTSLGLAGNRKMAATKCNMMLQASLIVSVSHKDETSFKDGTRLYRFSDREEIRAKYDELVASEPAEGTDNAVLLIALEVTLEVPSLGDSEATDEPQTFSGVSTAHLRPRRHSTPTSKEQLAGEELATLAAKYEKVIDIKDRKYNFKTYEKCFVGSDAVTMLVDANFAENRKDATAKMEQLLQAGLIHHVTHEHLFEDKTLFYRFTSVGDIKKSIDTIAALPTTPAGHDLVRYAALVQRYKQFAGLNVTTILNAFFGCEGESGWDLVDLENWRHNMKRWGFGRREDQDDDMVDRLAPLAVNVDPDEWDVTGDEEWESPWGILAQIAIFDQVPRSAFRGTSDAFKWDDLAIRATKVALEKGYFETAFKSTLNQFLLLLPLEHSESWEDQKLGVTLLLQLLSTVAVQDEGLSDYEIVKRLEFSKRLTTAFLEHAQVIAKFKRYPHRNRPHGRTTTLEERIWLASDLVPRWAKSQNPEDARNVIQLPVIPLKRLTKK